MKKKIGLIFLSVIFIMTIRPAFSLFFEYSIKHYLKNKIGAECFYDKIKKQKKGWSFYNLKISKYELFDFYAERLDFFIDVDWKHFNFSYRIESKDPNLKINKKAKLPSFKKSKNTFFNITNLKLITDHERACFFVNLFQKTDSKESRVEVFSKKNQGVANLEISHIKANVSYVNLSFNDLEISDCIKILNPFIKDSLKLKGVLNGYLSIQKKEEIDHFFSSLKLENASFSLDKKNLSFDVSSAEIELEYPNYKLAYDKNILKKFLDIRSKILFQGLRVKSTNSSKGSSLSDLSGFFSYNPSIGPKWSVKGKSSFGDTLEEISSEGKGFFNSLQSNWVEGNICFEKSRSASFKVFGLENSIRNCYLKIDRFTERQFQLLQDFSTNFYPMLGKVVIDKVNASLECDLKSDFDDTFEFNITDLLLKNLKVNLDQKIKEVDIQEFNFNGSFTSLFDESLSGVIKIMGADVTSSDPIYSVRNAKGRLELEKGSFTNSKLCFSLNNINTELSLSETLREVVANAKINGETASLANFLPNKKGLLKGIKNKLFESEITFKKSEKSELYGALRVLDKDKEELQFGIIFQDKYLKKLSHGWIKGEGILLNNLSFEAIQLNGIANFTASFEKEKISFLVKGKCIRGENDYFVFSSDYLGGKDSSSFESVRCLQGSFDFSSSIFHIIAPLSGFSAKLKKQEVEFTDIKGSIDIKNDSISMYLKNAKSCGVNFIGNLLLQKSFSNELELAIRTDRIYGRIEDFTTLLSYFNANMHVINDLKGDFVSLENGFEFQYKQNKALWRFGASFDNAEYNFYDHVILNKACGKIEVDSKGRANFKDVLGSLSADSQDLYELYIPFFDKNEREIKFDFRVSNSLRDVFRLLGEASIEEGQYKIKLDDNLSHFFSSKLNVDNLFIKDGKIQSLSIESLINLRDATLVFAFFKKTTSIFDKISLPDFIPIKGEVDCKFDYEKDKKSVIEVSGCSLSCGHFFINNFDLKADLKDNHMDVHQLNINDVKSRFSCRILNDHLEFRDFKASLKDLYLLEMGFDLHSTLQLNGHLKHIELDASILDVITEKKLNLVGKITGDGRFSVDLPNHLQKLQIESDLNLQTSNLLLHGFSFDSKNSIRAYFSYSDGWILDGLTFDVKDVKDKASCLSCKIGQLLYRPSEKKYVYEDAHVFFFEELFNKINWINKGFSNQEFMKIGKKVLSNKEISTCGEFDVDAIKLTCHIKEHQVDQNDSSYLFRNIKTTITPEALVINSNYVSSLFEFPLDFKIYYDENVHGRLIMREDNELRPMRVDFDFKNGFQIHSIVGNFHGISARMQKDGDLDFIASLKCDFKKIRDYVPPLLAEFFDELNLGKGYEFRGKFFSSGSGYQFKGTFTGKDIELGNCIYQTLMSDILINSKSVEITDLKVSDRSGIFKMKKLNIFKEKDKWSFSIPEFKMLEFRPSLLKKVGESREEIKPLVFREVCLQDLEGELEDKRTYKGHGNLSFINSFKRDHSVFDVPADFLGRIFGLDMELLIPVRGKADIELKDNKIYFFNLEDSYSEGNRSKFFLANKAFPHTLEFNGDLNIHIQMKHYVLFTFTESFILSIEGNLSDPKFSLKKKKTLFSK